MYYNGLRHRATPIFLGQRKKSVDLKIYTLFAFFLQFDYENVIITMMMMCKGL